MDTPWWAWLLISAAGLLSVLLAVLRKPWAARRQAAQLERARRDFRLQRERLEWDFFTKAARSGKPRGLRWMNCDFDSGVAFARYRKSRELTAFVGVTVSFEAIEGGGMEEVEAVGNLRAATAVFRYATQGWETDGRVVFNLEPAETIAYFEKELEAVGP